MTAEHADLRQEGGSSAPAAPLAAPAGPILGAGPGVTAAPLLRGAADVLALQAAAGNGAVARFLARQPAAAPAAPAPPPAGEAGAGGLADLLAPATAKVSQAGDPKQVTAFRDGSDVVVNSPGASTVAKVSLQPDAEPGPDPIEVGVIQTVVSSVRIGVYRKTSGEIVTQKITSFANVRDVSGARPAPAPWYEPPLTITAAERTAQLVVEDLPKMRLPAELQGGRLSEIRGADRFAMSVAARRGAELVHLKKFEWDVPWDVTLDSTQAGTGGVLDLREGGAGGTQLGGRAANEVGTDPESTVTTFESVADATVALEAGFQDFLRLMPRHERIAPDSYWKMVTALWKCSKAFSVTVEEMTKPEDVPKGEDEDTLDVTMRSHKEQTITANFEEQTSHELPFLFHMIVDPAQLSPTTMAWIKIDTTSMGWAFPFTERPAESIDRADGGRYRVKASIK